MFCSHCTRQQGTSEICNCSNRCWKQSEKWEMEIPNLVIDAQWIIKISPLKKKNHKVIQMFYQYQILGLTRASWKVFATEVRPALAKGYSEHMIRLSSVLFAMFPFSRPCSVTVWQRNNALLEGLPGGATAQIYIHSSLTAKPSRHEGQISPGRCLEQI